MAVQKLDKETRKALLNARKLIEALAKKDANEAETRKCIYHIFETVLGYNIYEHITAEYEVHGAGETVHCDFAIQLNREESSKPEMLAEIKRVNIDLVPKHLRQAASYAINLGCEWALLTNSKEWKLYHVSFTQPPQTKLIDSWNLISDSPITLARKFDLISLRNVKKNGLACLWDKYNVLTPHNILGVILSVESMTLIQRRLKKATDIKVSPEDIVAAVRHLLNEAAIIEMDRVKISMPEKKQRKKTRPSKASKEDTVSVEKEAETTLT